MNRCTKTLALLAACSLISTSAMAAAKKPAAKPKSGQPHVVQGTTQLKGEYAEFNKTYTLGKEEPINITLKSAEYTANRVKFGDIFFCPMADEKLLVLHLTYHNPQPEMLSVNWDTVHFTAVDATNTNREYVEYVGLKENNNQLEMELKPAQKIDVYTVIKVPAKGEVPKLIAQSRDNLVLRYDLRGKVKPLPAPYAAPDSKGMTALGEVPAKVGDYYPTGRFDIKVDSIEYLDENIGKYELEEGERFLVINFSVKAQVPETSIYWSTFEPMLLTEDGDTLDWNEELFLASRAKAVDMEMKLGQEVKVRHFFAVPEDVKVKTYSIRETEFEGSRSFVYDVSGVE